MQTVYCATWRLTQPTSKGLKQLGLVSTRTDMLSTVAGQETRQSPSSWAKAQVRGNLLENLLRCISSKGYSVFVKRIR